MAQLGFGIRTELLEKEENRYILNVLHIHAKKLGIYEGWPALNNIGVGKFVSRTLASIVPTARRFNIWHEKFTASAITNSCEIPGGILAPLIRGSGTPGKTNFFKHSHEQMIAEGSFVTLTGGDGYALTLSTLFFYLTHYPECQEKLAKEIRSVFPDSETEWITSGPRLSNCTYLHACILEAMRMVPPASLIPWRECESAGVFLGPTTSQQQGVSTEKFEIPIGTDIGVSPYTIFRRSDIFPSPTRFWPERWLDVGDEEERARAHRACKPFSIGPRSCSGQQVAMMMASIGVANLIRRFEFKGADGGIEGEENAPPKRFEDGWPELDFQSHFITMWKEGPWIQFRDRKGDHAF